jgi:ribosomal protein L40E
MECGHKNPGDVAFCTKCRAKMVLECADCGFKSPQGSEFCGSCGNETEFGIKERQSRERKEAEERQ